MFDLEARFGTSCAYLSARRSPMRRRGFTLIELLVVIAIIAILIAPAAARRAGGPRGGAADPVLEQPEADRPGPAQLRVVARLAALGHRASRTIPDWAFKCVGAAHAAEPLPGGPERLQRDQLLAQLERRATSRTGRRARSRRAVPSAPPTPRPPALPMSPGEPKLGHTNYPANAGTSPNTFTPHFDGLFGTVPSQPIVRLAGITDGLSKRWRSASGSRGSRFDATERTSRHRPPRMFDVPQVLPDTGPQAY